jgi:hypothetical protein
MQSAKTGTLLPSFPKKNRGKSIAHARIPKKSNRRVIFLYDGTI